MYQNLKYSMKKMTKVKFLYMTLIKGSFDLLFEDDRYDIAGPVGGCRTASGNVSIDSTTLELLSVNYYAEKPVRLFFDEEYGKITTN